MWEVAIRCRQLLHCQLTSESWQEILHLWVLWRLYRRKLISDWAYNVDIHSWKNKQTNKQTKPQIYCSLTLSVTGSTSEYSGHGRLNSPLPATSPPSTTAKQAETSHLGLTFWHPKTPSSDLTHEKPDSPILWAFASMSMSKFLASMLCRV